MGMIQGKPYWQLVDGHWVKKTPIPQEMGVTKYDRKKYNTEINRKRLLKERQAKNRENGM